MERLLASTGLTSNPVRQTRHDQQPTRSTVSPGSSTALPAAGIVNAAKSTSELARESRQRRKVWLDSYMVVAAIQEQQLQAVRAACTKPIDNRTATEFRRLFGADRLWLSFQQPSAINARSIDAYDIAPNIGVEVHGPGATLDVRDEDVELVQLLASSNAAFVIVDSSGIIVFASTVTEVSAGIVGAAAAGRKVSCLHRMGTRSMLLSTVKQAFACGKPQKTTFVAASPDRTKPHVVFEAHFHFMFPAGTETDPALALVILSEVPPFLRSGEDCVLHPVVSELPQRPLPGRPQTREKRDSSEHVGYPGNADSSRHNKKRQASAGIAAHVEFELELADSGVAHADDDEEFNDVVENKPSTRGYGGKRPCVSRKVDMDLTSSLNVEQTSPQAFVRTSPVTAADGSDLTPVQPFQPPFEFPKREFHAPKPAFSQLEQPYGMPTDCVIDTRYTGIVPSVEGFVQSQFALNMRGAQAVGRWSAGPGQFPSPKVWQSVSEAPTLHGSNGRSTAAGFGAQLSVPRPFRLQYSPTFPVPLQPVHQTSVPLSSYAKESMATMVSYTLQAQQAPETIDSVARNSGVSGHTALYASRWRSITNWGSVLGSTTSTTLSQSRHL